MANRTLVEAVEHDKLVRTLAEHYRSLGYNNIRADLSDWTQPVLIEGTKQNHIPDVTCQKNDLRRTPIIAEVETGSTISDNHTASQWSLFRDAATKAGGEFHLMVPSGIDRQPGQNVASKRLKLLRLDAEEIWVPKN